MDGNESEFHPRVDTHSNLLECIRSPDDMTRVGQHASGDVPRMLSSCQVAVSHMVRPHPFINKKNPHVSQHPQSHGISVLGYSMWPCFLLNPYLISHCRPEKPTCYAAERSERGGRTKKAGRPMNAHGPRPHEHSELLSSWLVYDSWTLLSREGRHFTLSLDG